jgi:uncharacterized protein YcgI (DUF1989 family)
MGIKISSPMGKQVSDFWLDNAKEKKEEKRTK